MSGFDGRLAYTTILMTEWWVRRVPDSAELTSDPSSQVPISGRLSEGYIRRFPAERRCDSDHPSAEQLLCLLEHD
jgi:hypothetical protein